MWLEFQTSRSAPTDSYSYGMEATCLIDNSSFAFGSISSESSSGESSCVDMDLNEVPEEMGRPPLYYHLEVELIR